MTACSNRNSLPNSEITMNLFILVFISKSETYEIYSFVFFVVPYTKNWNLYMITSASVTDVFIENQAYLF